MQSIHDGAFDPTTFMAHPCPAMDIQSQSSSPVYDDLPRSAQTCARLQPRHTACSVRSNLGDVTDLSLGGARILAKSGLRSPLDIELYAMNKSVTVRAKVAWSRSTGDGFKAEIGLEFSKLTRIQREVIESLSRGQMHRSLI